MSKWKSKIKFLGSAGIFAIILTVIFQLSIGWFQNKSQKIDKINIIVLKPFHSVDGMNRQRVYFVNNTNKSIINAKIHFTIPNLDKSQFEFELSPDVSIQLKDKSITTKSFVVILDRIIGNGLANKEYYIDLIWEGKELDTEQIKFDSDNCHKENIFMLYSLLNREL